MISHVNAGSKAWLVLALVSCSLTACGRTEPSTPVPDDAAAGILWLPAEARLENYDPSARIKDGRGVYVDGSAAVAFSITAGCDDVARRISEHFRPPEWQARSTQYLNPELPTSFKLGCQRLKGGGVLQLDSEGRPIPPQSYREWRGEWENGSGDIVSYVFGGPGELLRGYASYLPRHVVEAGRRRPGR